MAVKRKISTKIRKSGMMHKSKNPVKGKALKNANLRRLHAINRGKGVRFSKCISEFCWEFTRENKFS